MSKVICRLWFDLERAPCVPKELFRKLIEYPAVDLDVKGHMIEASPDSYHVEAEGEHANLNDFTTYINGVTRVIAVLHPGERECDVKPKFTREFEVQYLVPLPPDESEPKEKKEGVLALSSEGQEPNGAEALPKKGVKRVTAVNDETSVGNQSDNEGSLTMEPVDMIALRSTQMTQARTESGPKVTKCASKLRVSVEDNDQQSQGFDWPETELFEESESLSILSRRKRKGRAHKN